MSGTFVCWIPRRANCCASTYASSAAAIGSRTKTAPARRPWARCNCWPEPKKPDATSGCSAKACTATRANLRCAAFWKTKEENEPWRRRKQAGFRDPNRTLDNFDFAFNPKINRSLVFDLATGAFIGRREDALFLGPGGAGKSHLAQAIGQAAIQQNYRVLYRETHILLEELAEAVIDGTRKRYVESVATVPLLIIDDFGMRKLPQTAAEDLLEIVMRRYERASTLLTSNRPVEDWGKLLGDAAAVGAMLDRLLHHGHLLKCGPRSWRTKTAAAEG